MWNRNKTEPHAGHGGKGTCSKPTKFNWLAIMPTEIKERQFSGHDCPEKDESHVKQASEPNK
jgi:hypothetical protein